MATHTTAFESITRQEPNVRAYRRAFPIFFRLPSDATLLNNVCDHRVDSIALIGNQLYHDEHCGSRSNVGFVPRDCYVGGDTHTAVQLSSQFAGGMEITYTGIEEIIASIQKLKKGE